MKILTNEKLDKYTTVRIGGIAEKFYIPENVHELIDVIGSTPPDELRIIGGGSNLLINDQKTFARVIHLKEVDNTIEHRGNGTFYVGASVTLQKLIKHINESGYGGIEYLYSVPALVGGAIAMNAGRGRKDNLAISDYLEEIHVLDVNNHEVKCLSKEECEFSFRNSVFKKTKNIVIGAVFAFEKTSSEKGTARREERMDFVKRTQDSSGFNFGCVFNGCNRYIMHFVRLTHPGYRNGMKFSKKTSNWLIHKGEGTFEQAIQLMNRIVKYHQLIGIKIKTEVVIWE